MGGLPAGEVRRANESKGVARRRHVDADVRRAKSFNCRTLRKCRAAFQRAEPGQGCCVKTLGIALVFRRQRDDAPGNDFTHDLWLAARAKSGNCLLVSGGKHGNRFVVEHPFGSDELKDLADDTSSTT
jgi:hypothetical protein